MKNVLKKGLLIGLAYYVLILINACCHCKEVRHYLFAIDSTPVAPISYTVDGDTNFSYTKILNDSTHKNTFGLQFFLDGKKVVYKKAQQNLFINSAIACKCAADYYTSIDTISAINIATLLDFDASKPAGSDLSEYFKYLEINYEPQRIDRLSIQEFIYKSRDYYSYATSLQAIPLRLIKLSENTAHKMQFAIRVVFSNGKVLSDTTAIINYF